MRLLIRLVQRLTIAGLGIFTVWLIVFMVFETANRRLPWILAVGVTYGLAAYVILPRVIRLGLKILQHQRVPSYTITGDGLPGDPVNVALIGTLQQLRASFAAVGWCEADRLGLASAWGMIRAFVLNAPYPTAPFSSLYLFGRGQDIGFQKAIDNSPRKRHHIRFWAMSLTRAEKTWKAGGFWSNTDQPPADERVLWIGAGTKDTGLSGSDLMTGEEQIPLSPAQALDGSGSNVSSRRVLNGLIPASRRQQYVAARTLSNGNGSGNGNGSTGTPADPRADMFLRQVVQPWANLNRWWTDLDGATQSDAEYINGAQQSSALILLDFANTLIANVPNVWSAVLDSSQTAALSSAETVLYNVLSPALQQALVNAKQFEAA